VCIVLCLASFARRADVDFATDPAIFMGRYCLKMEERSNGPKVHKFALNRKPKTETEMTVPPLIKFVYAFICQPVVKNRTRILFLGFVLFYRFPCHCGSARLLLVSGTCFFFFSVSVSVQFLFQPWAYQ